MCMPPRKHRGGTEGSTRNAVRTGTLFWLQAGRMVGCISFSSESTNSFDGTSRSDTRARRRHGTRAGSTARDDAAARSAAQCAGAARGRRRSGRRDTPGCGELTATTRRRGTEQHVCSAEPKWAQKRAARRASSRGRRGRGISVHYNELHGPEHRDASWHATTSRPRSPAAKDSIPKQALSPWISCTSTVAQCARALATDSSEASSWWFNETTIRRPVVAAASSFVRTDGSPRAQARD